MYFTVTFKGISGYIPVATIAIDLFLTSINIHFCQFCSECQNIKIICLSCMTITATVYLLLQLFKKVIKYKYKLLWKTYASDI